MEIINREIVYKIVLLLPVPLENNLNVFYYTETGVTVAECSV